MKEVMKEIVKVFKKQKWFVFGLLSTSAVFSLLLIYMTNPFSDVLLNYLNGPIFFFGSLFVLSALYMTIFEKKSKLSVKIHERVVISALFFIFATLVLILIYITLLVHSASIA